MIVKEIDITSRMDPLVFYTMGAIAFPVIARIIISHPSVVHVVYLLSFISGANDDLKSTYINQNMYVCKI